MTLMSKPKNGAARNSMSEMERQCYDWGWEDAEKQVIAYLKSRIVELRYCSKNDCCSEHAYVLEGIVEDIQEDALEL